MLILWPENLFNLFVTASRFMVDSLTGDLSISIYAIMPSVIWFYFFLSDLDGFYIFFWSSCFGQKFSIMLKSSGENTHLHFVPDLSGKAFSPSTLCCYLWGFHRLPLQCWGSSCLFMFISVFFFFYSWMLDFIKCLFCVYWGDQ